MLLPSPSDFTLLLPLLELIHGDDDDPPSAPPRNGDGCCGRGFWFELSSSDGGKPWSGFEFFHPENFRTYLSRHWLDDSFLVGGAAAVAVVAGMCCCCRQLCDMRLAFPNMAGLSVRYDRDRSEMTASTRVLLLSG